MALWGRRDGDALTGNVSIASGNTELQGLTGATFLTELVDGSFVTAAGQEFKIVSITDANTAVVTPAANSAITNQAAVVNDKPKNLRSDEAANVINISLSEAQDANNTVDGIVTPGWTKYEEYTTGPGGSITRRRVEVLVAMKDPN